MAASPKQSGCHWLFCTGQPKLWLPFRRGPDFGHSRKTGFFTIFQNWGRSRWGGCSIRRFLNMREFIYQQQQPHRAFLKIRMAVIIIVATVFFPGPEARLSTEILLRRTEWKQALWFQQSYKELILTGINLSLTIMKIKNCWICSRTYPVRGSGKDCVFHQWKSIPLMMRCWLLCDNQKIMPHLHLPLQSGCDATLQRMGRRYTTKALFRGKLRHCGKNSGGGIGTDLIVEFARRNR